MSCVRGAHLLFAAMAITTCLGLQCNEYAESLGDCWSGITKKYRNDPLSLCDYTVALLDDDVYEADLHKYRIRECPATDDMCTSAQTYMEGEIKVTFGRCSNSVTNNCEHQKARFLHHLNDVYAFRIKDIVMGIENGTFWVWGQPRRGKVLSDEPDYLGRIEIQVLSGQVYDRESQVKRIHPSQLKRGPVEVYTWECNQCTGNLCNEVVEAYDISSSQRIFHSPSSVCFGCILWWPTLLAVLLMSFFID